MNHCKICESRTEFFAQAKVLEKYDVAYFQCVECGFVQTEDPYWLAEAYQQPITKSDYGLVARNMSYAQLTLEIITQLLDVQGQFLDYGAGYGVFVQLMRYFGLNFSSYDRYCENILAPDAVISELVGPYELVTAFEVFEHWVDPLAELTKLREVAKNLLFSTELLPANSPKPGAWHYYIPHEGQHIAFFTPRSLQIIAERLDWHLYTTCRLGHFFSAEPLPTNIAELIPWQQYEPQNIFPALQLQLRQARAKSAAQPAPRRDFKVVVDAVFFQLYQTGIARVWSAVLREWAQTEFGQYVIVLDRAHTAPRYEGLSYREIQPFSYANWERDRVSLQHICDEEGATIFISSYYTIPLTTPSVFMAYDMIPEVLGGNLDEPMWQAKHYAIRHACAYVGISQSTLQDLNRYFPAQQNLPQTLAHCGVDALFKPATTAEISQFRQRYGIQKPYFLLVAPSAGYKNSQLFFQAFAQLPTRTGFEVVCTGNRGFLDPQFRDLVPGITIHTLQLSDAELRLAYAGAIALVYPSRYEGFGMPVIEALACGCPVITSPVSSLPEAGGEAVLYVEPTDVLGMLNALCDVQKPSIRESLIAAGLAQAQRFNWSQTAAQIQSALLTATLPLADFGTTNYLLTPDWSQPEEQIGETLASVFQYFCTKNLSVTLVFSAHQSDSETIELLLSGVALELMMNAALDVTEFVTVTLVSRLYAIQWPYFLPHLQGRIQLDCDDPVAIATLPEALPVFTLDQLENELRNSG